MRLKIIKRLFNQQIMRKFNGNFYITTNIALHMEEKKLFLLDAYALIYRAYYALFRAPRITSKGLNTSAIFGFCNTLDEILRKENPSHIAVCFDPKGGTFRHEAYPEYKAQREQQPEDITKSVPYIKEILKAYNIPVIEVPGYEADDVIGTLAHRAEKEEYLTYMMTPDKDYGQLVTDRVLVYRPSSKGQGFEIRGPQQICERYGIQSPQQVIDLLALEGDVSDNVPGCPGVGEKTAVKLIAEFGSVEGLIENSDKIKGKLREKIEANVENIKFSKFLVTINTDVPIDVEISSLARKEPNVARLLELYTELEFKMFINRLGGKTSVAETPTPKKPQQTQPSDGMMSLFDTFEEPSAPTTTETQCISNQYESIATINEIQLAISQAKTAGRIGVCINAGGADAMTANWCGIAISTATGKAKYIAIPSEANLREAIKHEIASLFADERLIIVSHDVKRDYIIIKNEGIEYRAQYYDTSVAHYLLQPEMKHQLSFVAAAHLNYHTMDYSQDDTSTSRKATALGEAYSMERCCENADVVLRLYDVLNNELASEGLTSLMNDIELPFISVLAEMELTGVRIDVNELAGLSSQLSNRLHDMEHKAYQLAGCEFNIASPMQVGEILFGRLQIDSKARRTKTGAYSTTEEILEKYRATHPLVDLILKIRGLRKLLTTYINALPELINRNTGKIHTSYNQTVTATGRLSSSNPNLQNIPVRTDDGREIRRAFIADDGDLFFSADYSQIELRIIADLSGDTEMINAFCSGEDIHQATAAKIYKVPIDQVTPDQRRAAKTANFGIIYGISTFGLSERLGISRTDAKALIEGYFNTYPQIKQYMNDSVEKARQLGYVTTIKGRKRMLPGITSGNSVVRSFAERNAINAPIQGSAADIIKIAMINISKEMQELNMRSRMIMQVHDELVFNVKPEELDTLRQLVTRNMENAYHGRVPLLAASGVGKNWLEAH